MVDTNIKKAVAAHRQALQRIVRNQSGVNIQTGFDLSLTKLDMLLNRAFRGRKRSLTAGSNLLEINRLVTSELTNLFYGVVDTLSLQAEDVIRESIRQTAKFVGRITGIPGILDDPRHFEMAVQTRIGSIGLLRRRSLGILTTDLLNSVRGELSIAQASKDRVGETISDVVDKIDAERWKVERTTRTELCRAYNAAQEDAIDMLERDQPGFFKRWTERVSDATGAPMDKRVGKDSIVLHGQIVRPGQLFTMPEVGDAPRTMIGMKWSAPPNRPNDRAVLLPWRKEWKIPGYVIRGGQITRIWRY